MLLYVIASDSVVKSLTHVGCCVISGFRRDSAEICDLLGDITQPWVVIMYRRFGATYRFHVEGSRSPRKLVGFLDPKRRYRTTNQRCVISKKSADLMLAVVLLKYTMLLSHLVSIYIYDTCQVSKYEGSCLSVLVICCIVFNWNGKI
jgi:hypothetical protein